MAAKKKPVPAKKGSPKKQAAKKNSTDSEPGEQVPVRVMKSVQPEVLSPIEESEPAEIALVSEATSPEEPADAVQTDEDSEADEDMAPPARKRAKKIAISALILLIILLGVGAAYTWYIGQSGPQQAAKIQKPDQSAAVAIKPTAPRADTQESAAVEFISSPVAPGGGASINVKTVATSTCTISVTYNNVPANSPALGPQTADDFGNVSWNWTVPTSAPTGTWPVKVTCVRGAKSAVVQDTLVVAR